MKNILLSLLFTLAVYAQDISGTYHGTLTPEGTGDEGGTGHIVIKQTGEVLKITAGPSPAEQHETIRVERNGNQLKFEIDRGGDGRRLMKFDLLAKDGRLTGTITMMSEEGKKSARLDLAKQ